VAADGQRRPGGRRVPHRAGQPDPLGQPRRGTGAAVGIAHQERLGAGLQRPARERRGAQLAAEPAGLLDHGDRGAGPQPVAQPQGGGQSGDAAPDDRDVHHTGSLEWRA